MYYRLVCVGRRVEQPLLAAADDYRERLNRYVKTEVLWLRDGSLEAEREAMQRLLRPDDYTVALDERAKEPTTAELARRLSDWSRGAIHRVVFLLGGADGLHPELKRQAREQLALSKLTLPHRLAQVLLLEQLYRAHTILRGEPYHRA
jgi:23S rRNA (pseudouridine1915-N3)-methyltransferase